MAKKRHRIFALVAAALFLLTSVGFTVAVIWQINQEDKAVNNTQKQGGLAGTQLQNFTPVADVTELQKIDLKEGTGPEVQPGATITANYTGAIASTGEIFQSSYDTGQPFTAPMQLPSAENGGQGVLAGWVQGVPGMKVGGKRRLIIPASLAYGNQSPSPDIPANSALVFDIDLVAIK